jgi:hypothetical protein
MQQGARWRGSVSSTSAGDAGREETWARPVTREVPGRRGACPRVKVTVAKDAAGAGPGEAAREMGGGQSRGLQRGRGSDERPPPGGPRVRLSSSYLPSRSGSWSGRTQNPGRSFSEGMIAGGSSCRRLMRLREREEPGAVVLAGRGPGPSELIESSGGLIGGGRIYDGADGSRKGAAAAVVAAVGAYVVAEKEAVGVGLRRRRRRGGSGRDIGQVDGRRGDF